MSNAYRPSTRNRPSARSRRSSSRPPLYPVPSRSRPVRSDRSTARTEPIPFPQRPLNPGVRRLPRSRPMPLWLRWLIGVQRGSLVVVFLLAIATLVVYSGTVYTQHLWGKGYLKLKQLQRSERQVTAAKETMQNWLAKQAERPGAGLVTKTPASTIFLQSSPKRSQPASQPLTAPVEQPVDEPLSY